jgi:hypothetical protein
MDKAWGSDERTMYFRIIQSRGSEILKAETTTDHVTCPNDDKTQKRSTFDIIT